VERLFVLEHVAGTRKSRGAYRVSVGNLRERDHLKDPGADGMLIIK
jgi:hypothetical protein